MGEVEGSLGSRDITTFYCTYYKKEGDGSTGKKWDTTIQWHCN